MSKQLVGLFICVFVRESESVRIRDIQVETVKTGLGGFHGNKGAICLRMLIDDSSVCFINAHLAAHQKEISARNNDAASILKDTNFKPLPWADFVCVNGGDGTQILDHETIVIAGDLNYRIDLPREQVIDAIDRRNFDLLVVNKFLE